ncbi:MAG: hypothetical protein WCG80_06810 [Spirochaetales bacterium]
MYDLNSVLVEGRIENIKAKKDHTGFWVEIRNRRPKQMEDESMSHRFRIEVGSNLRGCPPERFHVGRSVRVVGHLRRESRLGPFVKAECVEFKGPEVLV